MQIQNNISLKPYNTFGIDTNAKYFTVASNIADLQSILTLADYPKKLILGGGSNILFTKDFEGLVILNEIKGKEVIFEDENFAYIKCNAGENWHEFVMWCIDNDYGGLENLSLIPGNVGTAPIQNIGAYGIEIKDVFESCEAISQTTGTLETFTKSKCNFGYRNSIFKQE